MHLAVRLQMLRLSKQVEVRTPRNCRGRSRAKAWSKGIRTLTPLARKPVAISA
jgi:hypothetical protein